MKPMIRGRYRARLADGPADVRAAQALRWQAFRVKRGLGGDGGLDADAWDDACVHVLVEECDSDDLVCCFRLLVLAGGDQIQSCYSAQYYDLAALARYGAPMAEVGRFCLRPGVRDPNVMRLAWAAMGRLVETRGVGLLFGCSSFMGTDAGIYEDAFAMLKDRHLAPRRWLPRVKSPEVFRFARQLRRRKPDDRKALLSMPPLLRSYLAMGGWVSDHAVFDRDLHTLHVFTGLEVGAIPPARVRSLKGTV